MSYVISLTSTPPRFAHLNEALTSLLRQDIPAKTIFLTIPRAYRRFPDWDGTLPSLPPGIEVLRTEVDLGPATKILPAARHLSGQETRILFGDDDRAYPRQWAGTLLSAAKAHPRSAVCSLGMQVSAITRKADHPRPWTPRAIRRWRLTDVPFQLRHAKARLRRQPEPGRRVWRRAGYVDIFEGCGGVVVAPDMFPPESFAIPEVAFSVDDVWLSGCLAKAGVPIWLCANMQEPPLTRAEQHAPLVTSRVANQTRAEANLATVTYLRDRFGIWP